MAESGLTLVAGDLCNRIARMIGEDDSTAPDTTAMSAQTTWSDYVVRAFYQGYRWFLTPSLLQQEFHRWSFLRKTSGIKATNTTTVPNMAVTSTTVLTAASSYFHPGHVGATVTISGEDYFITEVKSDTVATVVAGSNVAETTATIANENMSGAFLPDDFESFLSDLTSYDSAISDRVAVISESDMMAIQAQATATTGPRYASYRPITGPADQSSQRYGLLLYPRIADDTSIFFNYTYQVYPALATLNEDEAIYGGPQHAHTIEALCLAAAELSIKDTKGEHYDRAMELLAASIEFDKLHIQQRDASRRPYPIGEASATHDNLYLDIKREMGRIAGYGFDQNAWSHDEESKINFLMGRAERQVYWPPGVDHKWRFLQPVKTISLWQSIADKVDKGTTTVTATASTTVTASAATFDSSMVGYYICVHDGSTEVCTKIVSVTNSTTCVVADTVTFAADTFTVSKYFVTGSNSTTITAGDSQTPFRASMVGKTLSFYAKDGTASTRTIVSFTSTSAVVVDSVMPTETGGWGIEITADGYYRLPDNVSGVHGPAVHQKESGDVNFAVNITEPTEVRKMFQSFPDQTGSPLKIAFQYVESDGTAQYSSNNATSSQAVDMYAFPLPDEEYTLELMVDIIPPRLSASYPYPAGGPAFHELFLASAMAMAEMEFGGDGKHRAYFGERLAAAIAHDKRAFTAENLGHNTDRSDGRSMERPRNFHFHNNSLVTYSGGSS